jgi:hypothetical protein
MINVTIVYVVSLMRAHLDPAMLRESSEQTNESDKTHEYDADE